MNDDPSNILIIDDEKHTLIYLEQFLTSKGYFVSVEESPEAGLKRYSERSYDLVMIDLYMPGSDGINLLKRIKEIDSQAVIVIITGDASIETAVRAVKSGAFDYLTKPMDLVHLDLLIKRALISRNQSRELDLLKQQLLEKGSFAGLVGVSREMQTVYGTIRQMAGNVANVLVQGETGTGKEVVARAIHSLGTRADRSLVAVNCGE
jgi:DNA-binding NtrC family response regulator